MSAEEIRSLLEKYKTIAVVGLSTNPAKDSYKVAKYLKTMGYKVIPVNPFCGSDLGRRVLQEPA